jgi:hypothetical protein
MVKGVNKTVQKPNLKPFSKPNPLQQAHQQIN